MLLNEASAVALWRGVNTTQMTVARRTLSVATSPLYEERQHFHRELLIRSKSCRSSAPQLRLRFIRR
jgi:hypothetical protein